MGKRKTTFRLIIGVDPGNDCSGIAVFLDGAYADSRHGSPWTTDLTWALTPQPSASLRCYVEVPQNGTHTSRGGVHWAAGMVVSQILETRELARKDLRKVKPSIWRKGLGFSVCLSKKRAVEEARRYHPAVVDHNEAEAILIAAYGVLDSGGELQ